MVKVVCNQGIEELEIKGTIQEVYADTMTIIGAIFEAIQENENGERLGQIFRYNVENQIVDAFLIKEEITQRLVNRLCGEKENETVNLKS